ncbi:MAG: hypothetical protein LBL42_00690, partial [Tannerella sp.]|nr:hypothetical protein [Tannerella sp.]
RATDSSRLRRICPIAFLYYILFYVNLSKNSFLRFSQNRTAKVIPFRFRSKLSGSFFRSFPEKYPSVRCASAGFYPAFPFFATRFSLKAGAKVDIFSSPPNFFKSFFQRKSQTPDSI